ncbi:MAG: PKD domain-containing protein [Saprospiraceae bacterium]|nr:PKD domain-containing protein [Saprospiraceae bacterium]
MTFAQPELDEKRDWAWIIGADGVSPINVDGALIQFSDSSMIASHQSIPFDLYITSASICDTNGAILTYTNGHRVSNHLHEIMPGSQVMYSGETSSLSVHQGVLILPVPNSRKLVLLHPFLATAPNVIFKNYHQNYSVIDLDANGGLGAMTLTNQIIIHQTLEAGMLTACRHANGRDWWILVPEWIVPNYFRLLLDPAGLHLDGEQIVGSVIGHTVTASQAVFSPDGQKYVRSKGNFFYRPDTLEIYDFDRCTGLLSNPVMITHAEDSLYFGSFNAISPNSRYLYHTTGKYMYQYDLQAPDIKASRVRVATAQSYGFDAMQLAPDGRIYDCSPPWAFNMIKNPDLPGIACGVCENCVSIPAKNWRSIPNYPNYRLGPVDGSACDTLGLDNLPQARFRYDNPFGHYAEFRNVSFGEPDAYVWDFGDPASGSDNSSTERNPVHTFSAAGTYTVCLTASNALGEQTRCQSVRVGVISAADVMPAHKIEYFVTPNPILAYCRVWCPASSAKTRRIILYDANGRLVLEQTLSTEAIQYEASLSGYPSGLYLLCVVEDGVMAYRQKLIKAGE